MKKNILISSGGSGGHIIPSTIIYEHLKNDFDVFLTTDKRGVRFLKTESIKKSLRSDFLSIFLFFCNKYE